MNLLRTTERSEQKYALAFLGYGNGNADGQAELELTYNYGFMPMISEMPMAISL